VPYKDLTSECRQRFRAINLHWHDLRHEDASRLVERGVPLAQVRDLLGHASIFITERYDNQKFEVPGVVFVARRRSERADRSLEDGLGMWLKLVYRLNLVT
jgi:site-specific recombinase XerC